MLIPLIIAGVVVVAFVLFAFSAYTVAEPNEAVLVSGLGAKSEDSALGFKIVSGKGTFVVPFFQRTRRFSLDQRQVKLEGLECLSSQRIPVVIDAVAAFKVGDQHSEIANSARRFLDKQPEMVPYVEQILEGHLRTIIGGMTVEELLHDRQKLVSGIRESCSTDMEKYGLVIDSLQVQRVHDTSDYIKNLTQIQAKAVERDARVATAEANRVATLAEQEADAKNAEARQASAMRQAQAQAAIDKANAEAAQAGPLAETQARQAVVQEETKIAVLEAEREEKRLDSEVRKQADAQAYQTVTLAEAERAAAVKKAEAEAARVKVSAEAEAASVKLAAEAKAQQTRLAGESEAAATELRGKAEATATQAKGEAEGASIRAKSTATAEGIAKRAEALAKESKAVIDQQVAENLPEIIRAAAEPLASIQGMTVLNGGEGVMDMVASTVLGAIKTGTGVRDLIRGADEVMNNHSSGNHTSNKN